MKKWQKYLYLFSFLGILSVFLFIGYLAGLYKIPPYQIIRRVELNLVGNYFDRITNPKVTPIYYDSIFLRLYSSETDIRDRLLRQGYGGGMTSFGDDVLLLTYDGQIFAFRSEEDVKKTELAVPDNGFSDYVRAAESDQFKHLTHRFIFFRYNDILFYQSESKRGLAISYTEFDSINNCYSNTVASLSVDPEIKTIEQLSAIEEDWEILFRSQPCLPLKEEWNAIDGGIAGGRIVFSEPSTIFLGSGDYHWDGMYAPKAIAQDPAFDYGKIIGIDLDTRKSRTVSTGHRNPQGIALDRESRLWIVEHGLRGGDELNRILEGKNYGWPEETLGTQYSKLPVPGTRSYGRHETFTEPTFAWLPSVAISNLTLIENFHDSWDGDLMMGSLKSQSLFRIRIKDNRVLFSEKIDIGERIRYVHQHTDGRLVLWTDSKKIIFLTAQLFEDNFVDDYLAESIEDVSDRNKIREAINTCRQCHSIEAGDHINAPNLALIFGSKIGSTDYENYSGALSEKEGIWTRKNLKQFLTDPNKFAPGTTMPNPAINDEAVIEELIFFLEEVSKRSPDI